MIDHFRRLLHSSTLEPEAHILTDADHTAMYTLIRASLIAREERKSGGGGQSTPPELRQLG